MDDQKQKIAVDVTASPMSDASPTGTFIFSFISFCIWALNCGIVDPASGAVLALGVAQLGVFVAYTVVSVTLLAKGDNYGGNLYLVFVAVFAGVCGSANVFSAVFAATGIAFDMTISNIFLLMAGLFLLLTSPGTIRGPKTDFLCGLLGGIGITGGQLVTFGLLPGFLTPVFGWLIFAVGVIALYGFFAGMYGFLGIKLPIGAPKSGPQNPTDML